MGRPTSDTARPARPARPARGLLALVLLALAWAFVMQVLGWAQTSNYALVKSLADGTASIDRYHWETRDKAWTDEHFFSVKAPGLPFVVLPLYEGMRALGAPEASRDVARAARRSGESRWAYKGLLTHEYGFDPVRARLVRKEVEGEAPIVWALGLLGSVLPAFLLLLTVRAVVERVTPGMGTAAAVMLGAGTLVMVFASQLFGHMLSALLAFAAFALLWRERDGHARLALVVAAGVLSGLAVTVEYPLAIAGAIVGCYAISRSGPLARGGAYSAGVALGVAPLLLYNQWAYGYATHLSYDNAVEHQGFTGHWTLGLNEGGFFGIGIPRPDAALELLISSRGLFVVSPIVVAAIAGTWLLYRSGRRAEARTITAVSLAFLVYDAGYWLPFGGGSPGPRFLIPILPFLCVGLGLALQRMPAVTLGLAVPSVLTMLLATATYPLIGDDDVGEWVHRVLEATFVNTPLVPLGVTGWLGVAPLLVLLAAAIACAARATEGVDVRADLRWGIRAVLAWGAIAVVGPAPWGDAALLGNWDEFVLVLTGVVAGLAALAVAALRAGMPVRALAGGAGPELAGGSPRVAWRRSAAGTEVVEGDPATDLAL